MAFPLSKGELRVLFRGGIGGRQSNRRVADAFQVRGGLSPQHSSE